MSTQSLKIHHLLDEDEKKKGKKKVKFAELPPSEKRDRTASNERKVEIKDEDGEGEEEDESEGGVCVLSRVGFKETYGSVTLREIEGLDYDGATLIEGFPGSTFTSMICASFLVEANHLRLIGTLTSDKLPAKAIVENNHATSLIRIMGNKEMVIFQSDVAIPSEIINDVVTATLEFARRHRCRMLVTMQGLHKGVNDEKLKAAAAAWANRGEADRIDGVVKAKVEEEDADRVRYLTSDLSLANALKDGGLKAISSAVISGIPGLILSRGSMIDPYTPGDSAHYWPSFFVRAGVPSEVHREYKECLLKAGLDSSLLSALTKEVLDKSGLTNPGHQLKLLKQAELESHAKNVLVSASPASSSASSPASTPTSTTSTIAAASGAAGTAGGTTPTHPTPTTPPPPTYTGRVELACLLSPSSLTDARSAVAVVKILKAHVITQSEMASLEEKAEELELKIRTAFAATGGDITGARLVGATTLFI